MPRGITGWHLKGPRGAEGADSTLNGVTRVMPERDDQWFNSPLGHSGEPHARAATSGPVRGPCGGAIAPHGPHHEPEHSWREASSRARFGVSARMLFHSSPTKPK